MPSNSSNPYGPKDPDRYQQGDILRGIDIVEWAEPNASGEIEILIRPYRYLIVLSQECDLQHDFLTRSKIKETGPHDKYLFSLLLCPAYPAEPFRFGKHLDGCDMQRIGSDDFKRLKQNNLYRYHFLQENEDKQIPELVLDFKHYITMPRDVAYRKVHRDSVLASLNDLYREHLSQRFAHYLSRIGLPEQ